ATGAVGFAVLGRARGPDRSDGLRRIRRPQTSGNRVQKILIPAPETGLILIPPCSIEGVVDRGVRRRSGVRCRQRIAVERREAQGPLTKGSCVSQDAQTSDRKEV